MTNPDMRLALGFATLLVAGAIAWGGTMKEIDVLQEAMAETADSQKLVLKHDAMIPNSKESVDELNDRFNNFQQEYREDQRDLQSDIKQLLRRTTVCLELSTGLDKMRYLLLISRKYL